MQRDVGLITSAVFKRPAEHSGMEIDGEVPGPKVVRANHSLSRYAIVSTN